MKKILALMLLVTAGSVFCAPVFADTVDTSVSNVKSSTQNFSVGLNEVLNHTHAEASKGKNMAEQFTGIGVGGTIAARQTLYHAGAGVIDLLTFWIPKTRPTMKTEKAA